jgi:hypothetical protein
MLDRLFTTRRERMVTVFLVAYVFNALAWAAALWLGLLAIIAQYWVAISVLAWVNDGEPERPTTEESGDPWDDLDL